MEEKERARAPRAENAQEGAAKQGRRRRPRHRPHPRPAAEGQNVAPRENAPQSVAPTEGKAEHSDAHRDRNRRRRRRGGHQNRQHAPTEVQAPEHEVAVAADAEAEVADVPAPVAPVKPAVEEAEAQACAPDATPAEPVPTTEVVGVHFRRSAKTYYFDPRGKTYKKGEFVIAQTANGMEYCEVSTPNRQVPTESLVLPLRAVVRTATADDTLRYNENRDKEIEAYNFCVRCIDERGLEMKLIDTEFSFDNSKLLFYYISEDRVDFRDLVKDLASEFHVRIEMRQIGIRDEAKMLGGLGSCGRPFCCSTFLPDFAQVSIKMAKEQGLSLNSAKISGSCGRLMCCLRFEHETYEQELKVTPKVDSTVRTESGEEGIVVDAHPLTGLCKVRMCESPEEPPKVYARENLTVVGYQKGAGAKLLAKYAAERAAQKQAKIAQKEAQREAQRAEKGENP